MENRAPQLSGEINEDEIRLFVGKNADYYLYKWEGVKYPTWHGKVNWSAFFAGTLWLGYRKMYAIIWLYGGVFLLVDIIQYLANSNADISTAFDMGVSMVLGTYGNRLYHKHMKKKISHIKTSCPIDLQNAEIAKAGGTSWFGVGMTVLIIGGCFVVSEILRGIITGVV